MGMADSAVRTGVTLTPSRPLLKCFLGKEALTTEFSFLNYNVFFFFVKEQVNTGNSSTNSPAFAVETHQIMALELNLGTRLL